jgi:excinuclease UvrABC nuclease subunit
LNPVVFGRDADLLLFLARIRDETHRFAVSVHRKSAAKIAGQVFWMTFQASAQSERPRF